MMIRHILKYLITHPDWAVPTMLGVIDTYGIELIHPMREGCRP